jgi:carboxylate-amine ligase
MTRCRAPAFLQSLGEYEAYIAALVAAGIIADSTFVWWALRPSLQHPTLELRLTDCCTAVDDAVAIAALYRAMVHHLVRHRETNASFSAVARALAEENRWRAQRYGTGGTYVDVVSGTAKPFAQLLEETLSLLQDDIAELEMADEMQHLRRIVRQGTSAHRQLEHYRALRKFGRPPKQAIREVTKWLRASTEAGRFVDEQEGLTPARNAA